MEISKLGVLLVNEHPKDEKKNATNDFRINFAMYSFTQKRPCQWNARKFSVSKDLNQNGSLSIS